MSHWLIACIAAVVLTGPSFVTLLAIRSHWTPKAREDQDRTETTVGLFCNLSAGVSLLLLVGAQYMRNGTQVPLTVSAILLSAIAAPVAFVLLSKYSSGWVRGSGIRISVLLLLLDLVMILTGGAVA
jgi:hypothetical protein